MVRYNWNIGLIDSLFLFQTAEEHDPIIQQKRAPTNTSANGKRNGKDLPDHLQQKETNKANGYKLRNRHQKHIANGGLW